MLRQYWWKILSFLLLMYTCIWGMLVKVPVLDGRLQQSIRSVFFHVPMWFGMMTLLTVSVIYSLRYLKSQNPVHDFYASEYARTGIVFGLLGIVTGAIWANYQWGAPWSGDPKQNGAAIAMLIYLAYFILRGSITDLNNRWRISAVYNVFAYAMLFPAIWILPRMSESLHPGGMGSEGNPGLNPNDTTSSIELVLWPAVIGWTLLGVWISTLRIRFRIYEENILSNG